MPGLGGAAVPPRGLGVIGRQPAIADVEIADQCRRVRIAGQCRAAHPGFAEHSVLLDVAPFHQRQPPAQLRRALPALGRVAIELGRDRGIPLHADALLGQYRQQIDRSRQFGFGGAAQMLGDLAAPRLVLRPRRQRQRVAEAAFRAAGRRRALVPAMRLVEIAHLFRAAGQHIGEHRLGLGRAGLGGLPRPFAGGGEIGLAGLFFGKQALAAMAGETVHAQAAE